MKATQQPPATTATSSIESPDAFHASGRIVMQATGSRSEPRQPRPLGRSSFPSRFRLARTSAAISNGSRSSPARSPGVSFLAAIPLL